MQCLFAFCEFLGLAMLSHGPRKRGSGALRAGLGSLCEHRRPGGSRKCHVSFWITPFESGGNHIVWYPPSVTIVQEGGVPHCTVDCCTLINVRVIGGWEYPQEIPSLNSSEVPAPKVH